MKLRKWKKTASGLEQMITENDSERDADVIKALNDTYSTTIDAIENKKSTFHQRYNNSVSCEDN